MGLSCLENPGFSGFRAVVLRAVGLPGNSFPGSGFPGGGSPGGAPGGSPSGDAACPCGARCASPPASIIMLDFLSFHVTSVVLLAPLILRLASTAHTRRSTDVFVAQYPIEDTGGRAIQVTRFSYFGNPGFSAFRVLDAAALLKRQGTLRVRNVPPSFAQASTLFFTKKTVSCIRNIRMLMYCR